MSVRAFALAGGTERTIAIEATIAPIRTPATSSHGEL
jgi:hypothetical protein